MTSPADRSGADGASRALEVVLATIGVLATVAGASGVLRGAREVPEGGPVSPSVDSEYRFYAAWYHVLGIELLVSLRKATVPASVVHATAAGAMIAAVGRLVSRRSVGKPHWSRTALMVAEFAIAIALPPWHANVVRRGADRWSG